MESDLEVIRLAAKVEWLVEEINQGKARQRELEAALYRAERWNFSIPAMIVAVFTFLLLIVA